VSETVELLGILEPVVAQTLIESAEGGTALTEKFIVVLTTVLETLAELVQGPCRQNQVAIIAAGYFTILNRFLSAFKFSADEPQPLMNWIDDVSRVRLKIKTQLLNLTLSLLESQPDERLLVEMCETLDFELLISELQELYELMEACEDDASCKAVLETISFDDERAEFAQALTVLAEEFRSEGFQIYCLLLLLRHYEKAGKLERRCDEVFNDGLCCQKRVSARGKCILHALEKSFHPRTGKSTADMNRYFKGRTRMLEVVHAGLLQRIYFRVPEECIIMRENQQFIQIVQDQMYDVPRDNPQEKAEHFVRTCSSLCFRITHLANIAKDPRISWCATYQDFITAAPSTISLLLSGSMLLFFGTSHEHFAGFPLLRWLVNLVGFLHVIATAAHVMSLAVVEVPLLVALQNDGEGQNDPQNDSQVQYRLCPGCSLLFWHRRSVFRIHLKTCHRQKLNSKGLRSM